MNGRWRRWLRALSALSLVGLGLVAAADAGAAGAAPVLATSAARAQVITAAAPTPSTQANRTSPKAKHLPVLEAGVLYRAAGSDYGGFGDGGVRPEGISTSGVGATNGVTKIAWRSWGGRTAVGAGRGCVLKGTGIEANCRVTRATVVAYDLSTCAGKPAYLAVTWYFPSLGQKLSSEKGTVPNPSCGAKTSAQASTTTSSVPASSSTTSASTTTTSPPATTSALCTVTALVAAAKVGGMTNVVAVSPGQFRCTGGFAAAGVTLGSATGGGTGSQVTGVFKTVDGSWQLVDGETYCAQNLIPSGIRQLACTSN